MNYRLFVQNALAGLFLIGSMSLTLESCKQERDNYTVTVPMLGDSEGMMAYLMDYDTSELLDSAVVTNDRAVFSGKVDSPVFVRVLVDHQRLGQMILEKGDITFSHAAGNAKGSDLNERLNAITKKENEIQSAIQMLDENDSLYNASVERLSQSYDSLYEHALRDNADNPIGYRMFIYSAYDLDSDSLEAKLLRYPRFASSVRIVKLRDAHEKRKETSKGRKYKDFTIPYNNKDQRLSDYVGKDGKYTLVDFWAGWCKPCIRETATVRKIYEKYGPDGSNLINVVGVAVWDDPDNSLKAIDENSLPWPQILDAGSVPTDLYGISGIPCIILISPDGTIVMRDLQGDDLMEAVDEIMGDTMMAHPEKE